ncbi:GNAT family N-acetyltransferase [Allorhizocola rhizosphaerae]|uniref:GNAT family N-acetyltransferase n=1 Tax=Allorhizocola rhizosphaerae TaxID=1872709 RepID=UPI000E3E719B|nr:GNAT family N-acetyltransferase [Allorhizocola rhizosphaerae]
MKISKAGAEGAQIALALLDGAAQWLVELGRTGQWGTEKQSTHPRRIAQARAWVESDGLYLAWLDDVPVGALAVGEAPQHIPVATEPELYVNFLVTSRAHAGLGIGGALLDHAASLARERGVGLLRVDCYAGDDRALVRYYESQGFTPTEPFTVDTPRGPWHGQVLSRRV